MTQREAPRPESGLYTGGHAAQQDDEQTIVRLGSSSSLCEEDSDSGSWWSYPSECGSVVDVNRVVSFALHATDDLDSLRSCFASLEGDVVPQSVPSPKQQHQQRSPDYRDSRPANARSGVGDTLDNGCITETAKQPGIPADQVRTALGQINRANLNPTKTFRKSSLVGADDRRPPSAVPSIERHVTFKDLSSPSSGSDEEHYERKPPQYRNRNHSVPAGCHGVGEEKQAFVDNGDVAAVAGEADLDDSGYLDGDSTSSSSDVSPPSSLGWESGIHTTATRKAGGVRDSRGVGQRCPGDHRGNDLFEPEPPKRPDDSNQTDGKQAMNGFYGQNNAVPSAHAFVHTEISVCESVRREDSYEYYRNGTRVAKLNNVNQTSWSESSCTDSSEVCTPLEKPTHLEQTAVSAPGQNKNSARAPEAADDTSDGARHQHHHHQSAPPRRVLPSVDEVQKRQQNVPPSVEVSRKHQQEASGVLPKRQSAPRESGKSKKENNGGNAWNADGARTTTRATKGDVAYEHWRHIPARDVRDEGTSCDLEEGDDADDYDSESEDSGDAPSSPSRDELRECADRADARAGTVSATATSRAVARSRPGGGTASEPASRASALASVRAQARDPFLALAVATAKAATTASAEASREIYAGCKPFSAAPDLDVFVRTACSVGGGESAALLADRAKQARDMPDSGYIAVSSPYKVSSVRADVHLPTPVRYKEFSSLQLGGAASQPGVTTATNGHGELAREPLPCEQRFLHVHSDVLPTREDRSPPTPPPRYTPSPVLREDRVRLLRTPVKSTPVLVDSLPDSDDCDVAAAAAPCPPVPPPRNPHNGILRMTKRPATLPVNGEATVYRKPPLPQQPLQQQHHRLLRPPPPPVRQRSPPADPAEHLERITGYHTARRLAQALPKPQVVLPDQPYSHPGGRLVSSRRRFFENLQRQVVAAADPDADSPSERLLGFQASAQAARESLAKSSPDLAALEADAFRRSRNRPDRYPPVPYSDATPPSPAVPRSPAVPPESFSRLVEETRNRYFLRSGRRPRGSPGQDERRRSKSLGYLETDVDTLQCRQVKRPQDPHTLADPAFPDYSEEEPARADSPLSRARSMDRFLDDEVNAGLGERAKSEHELRVERSLQKLQLPDWYKRHSRPAETGFLRSRRGSTASTTSTGRPAWQGLGSRTPSAASLAATSASAPTTNATNARNLVIPKRVTAPDWRCWHASRESLSSGCASPHDGSLSRWGSVSSAPAAAWSYRSFRQPYLGWRATPSTGTTTPMSTGSRPVSPGASLWTPPPSHPPQQQSETSEVEASAVGSVLRSSPHPPPCSIPRDRYSYVQGIYGDGGGWNDEHDSVQQEQDDACTSSSMRQHRQLDQQQQEVVVSDARPAVWMESSFVGAKPGSSTAGSPASSAAALDPRDEAAAERPKEASNTEASTRRKQSTTEGDVTLEDVLSSLLALADSSPSHSRLATPCKPPASPVSPDIRHVSFAPPPPKGLFPEGQQYGRRCSEGAARPPTPISILKHEDHRWETSPTQDAPLLQQTSWASTGDIKLTVPSVSSGSSSLDHSPERTASAKEESRQDIKFADEETQPEEELPSPPDSDSEAPGLYLSPSNYNADTSDQDSASADPQPPSAAAEPMTVRCHWGDCNKAVPKGPNGKVKVHTCPTCYGYFCSRACRGRHRDAKRCPFTRVSNLCQEVLHRIRHDPTSRHQLSLCAQRGLLSRGRGVIRLVFQGPQRAAQFLEAGWGEVVRGQMFYVARDDLLPHDMGPRVYARVRALCDDYDPGRKFVLLVAVCVTQEVVTPAGLGAISREMVVKAMKLRLSGPLPEEDVQTLILPVVSSSAVPPPAAGSTSNGLLPQHRHRLQGLHHVERQLEARGIDLAGSYPELYAKIRAFVDSGELFAPVCTFPVDVRTGQVFMCIVLPWADQELLDRMAGTRSAASVRNKKRWAF